MARYVLKNIQLTSVREQSPFRVHYLLKDDALAESVRKRGVIEPVIVSKEAENSFQVIAGHKRAEAARAAGLKELPALEIQGSFLPADLFLFSVLSNWRQEFSDLDKAWILHRAQSEFGIRGADERKEILSVLNLPAEEHFFQEAEKLMKLHPKILSVIALGSLPARGAQSLMNFTAEDQEVFARRIAENVFLTTNQFLQLGEWLFDLLKMSGKPLDAILAQEPVDSVLRHSETDKRQKGERLVEAVKGLRFPQLTGREKKLRQLSVNFRKDFPDMTVEAPASFESEGFTLKVRIRRPESIDEALEAVKAKKNVLNSLFDFML